MNINFSSFAAGQSENAARKLFEVARESAPSVIFLDEITSLLNTKSITEEQSHDQVS